MIDRPPAVIGGTAPLLSVGYVCTEYPVFEPHHGGIGSFVQTLATALVDAGHRPTVYGFSDRAREWTDRGVRLVTLPRIGVWSSIRAMQLRIARDLAGGAIDLAESAESEALCLPGGSGSVVRFHGSHHFWCATLPQRKRYGRLLLEQIAIRRARGLCAVSRFAADVTRRAMRLGTRSIEVLTNPVDTNAFTPRPRSVVPGRVLFVGAITEKKGVRELCASMEQVLERHPEAELQLIGRDIPAAGGLLRETIERTLSSRVRRSVQFLGPKSRQDVSREMAAAQICAFPSHMETQGIVFVEGMACGRPVIAPSRGPGPEVLGPAGECGLLVDPSDPRDIADKINRLLDDPALGNQMGVRGRQRALAQFSLAPCLERNVEFYARHLSAAARRRRTAILKT
ncbi:MAG: glycosyltransferase family 4 protein [Acidobacteriota bacterium]